MRVPVVCKEDMGEGGRGKGATQKDLVRRAFDKLTLHEREPKSRNDNSITCENDEQWHQQDARA